MFGPRESREFGRGWQVMRVRENSWAEQQGLRAGDELHGIEGQFIEVMPEAEVMELLQRRPVTLTWLRRLAAAEVPEEETTPKEAWAFNGQHVPVIARLGVVNEGRHLSCELLHRCEWLEEVARSQVNSSLLEDLQACSGGFRVTSCPPKALTQAQCTSGTSVLTMSKLF